MGREHGLESVNLPRKSRLRLETGGNRQLERGPALSRSNEYAAAIINALAGGAPFTFNGNVSNRGYISNLPDGACVEVPIQANATGLHPVTVGALPTAVSLLTNLSSQIEELAITGCLTGDRNAIYLASYHDPLCAARLSLAEIRSMVDEMFAQAQPHLPQFS